MFARALQCLSLACILSSCGSLNRKDDATSTPTPDRTHRPTSPGTEGNDDASSESGDEGSNTTVDQLNKSTTWLGECQFDEAAGSSTLMQIDIIKNDTGTLSRDSIAQTYHVYSTTDCRNFAYSSFYIGKYRSSSPSAKGPNAKKIQIEPLSVQMAAMNEYIVNEFNASGECGIANWELGKAVHIDEASPCYSLHAWELNPTLVINGDELVAFKSDSDSVPYFKGLKR